MNDIDSKLDNKGKDHIYFLDGIKIIACIGVFITHYVGAFYSMRNGSAELGTVLNTIIDSPLKLLWDGNLLVFVFAIISGYLCKQKQINTFSEMVVAVFMRYLRFCIPLLFANLFVLLIQSTIGFRTQDIAVMLNNTWLATSYTTDVSLSTVIKESFLLTGKLNGPLWTIRPFMIGSALVYVYSYISTKTPKFFCIVLFLSLICIIIFMPVISGGRVILACFAGVFVDLYWRHVRETNQPVTRKYDLIIVFILCLSAGLQDLLHGIMPRAIKSLVEYGDNFRLIYAVLFVAFLYRSKMTKKALSASNLTRWASLSFPIYIFHYPILCSLSLMVFYRIGIKADESIAFIATLIMTATIVWMVSFLYVKTLGKAISGILKKINANLLRIVPRIESCLLHRN